MTARNSNAELAAEAARWFVPNYRPAPVALVKGEGARVWDADGNAYLDFIAGIATTGLGHAHPGVTRAVQEQAARFVHASNLFVIEPAVTLGRRLCQAVKFDARVFFCNSGAEANEAALKLVRRWWWEQTQPGGAAAGKPARVRVVAADHSFHGRTLGALSITGNAKYKEGFGPIPGDVTFVPYGDVAALERAVDGETAALFLEPLQGEGGVHVPPADYLAAARRVCDATGALLVLDEVQTGMGRTGALFAHELSGICPDVMTLAKGLGNGYPIGAMLARADVAAVLRAPSHGSTFGGNFVACAAANAVLDALQAPGFLAGVSAKAERLRAGLAAVAARSKWPVREVRGMGLLIGFEFARPAPGASGPPDARTLMGQFRDRGLLIGVAGENVLRLAPPLIVGNAEIDEALGVFEKVICE